MFDEINQQYLDGKLSVREYLMKAMTDHILFFDGAMGTMIQKNKFTEEDYRGEIFKDWQCNVKGNNELLNLTQPDAISKIHELYLEAGSDIIGTNTFNGTRIPQSDYHTESYVHEINVRAAQLCKAACVKYTKMNPSRPRFAAGCVGPTNKTASISPDVEDPSKRNITFDELVESYYEQVNALIEGGVDILMVETVFDTLNAKAALFAIEKWSEEHQRQLPIILSCTIVDTSGRNLSGQTPEAFYISTKHCNPLAIGLNCSLGAPAMKPFLERLCLVADCPVHCYPNAGLPNAMGGYDDDPVLMAKWAQTFAEEGLINIIGGCCGSTPVHIKAIHDTCYALKPHDFSKNQEKHILYLSGLEHLVVDKSINNFINIGERCNISGSLIFKKLVKAENYSGMIEVARKQVLDGAQIIDINVDDGMIDSNKVMCKFLNYLMTEPDVCKVPIMIDSSNFELILNALKCIQGKSVVNSISLKVGEEEFIRQAKEIHKYGAALVVMAFDETGQATSLEKKVEVCERSYRLLVENGIPPEDIIFDHNILTIGTGMEEHADYANNFINAIPIIKKDCPYCHFSGGVSNLSFSFRGLNEIREAMHSVFLYYAIQNGMDLGIVNAGMLQVYDDIPKDLLKLVEDVVLNKHPNATEALLEYADELRRKKEEEKQNKLKNPNSLSEKHESWREKSIEERIQYSLVKGISDYVNEDMNEIIKLYQQQQKDYLTIIEGPLMAGMNQVGDLFGSGKMFLPQVIKSARVMKQCVNILLPYIESNQQDHESKHAGKVLIATVKGDVHDIGKNIVSVVLACNNFEVKDLGVMVDADTIVQAAKEYDPDIIALSGLITPSLDEMVNVAKKLKEAKIFKPLQIGGATTSKVHCAVKIAPVYHSKISPVVHSLDASRSVAVCRALLDPVHKEDYIQSITESYEEIRNEFYATIKDRDMLSFEEANDLPYPVDFEEYPPMPIDASNPYLNHPTSMTVSVETLLPFIDWTTLFTTFGLHGRYPNRYYPDILKDTTVGEQCKELYQESMEIFKSFQEDSDIQVRTLFSIYVADSTNNVIHLYDQYKGKELLSLPMLRQQMKVEGQQYYTSISDFIAPHEAQIEDHVCILISQVHGIDLYTQKHEHDQNYNKILIQALSDRLAEACEEYMHQQIRTRYWGFCPSETTSVSDLIKGKYQGIRPAIGYPSIPDHTLKQDIWKLLNVKELIHGELTETMAMYPASSVCSLVLAHPQSHYFSVNYINKDQLMDYCKQRNWTLEEGVKWLKPILNDLN